MTTLSVNLNKIAWLRNARGLSARPNLIASTEVVLAAGALGITLHPRPDLRHITPTDVCQVADYLKARHPDGVELNLEGNPFAAANNLGYPGFLALVEKVMPEQCTLVPDSDDQLTSDHGFDALQIKSQLTDILSHLKHLGIRSSVFVDPNLEQIEAASAAGADRIELYTGPYAQSFALNAEQDQPNEACAAIWEQHAQAATLALNAGMTVNAGHDLDLKNLPYFLKIRSIAEVSIGHALIADALEYGLADSVGRYLKIIDPTA